MISRGLHNVFPKFSAGIMALGALLVFMVLGLGRTAPDAAPDKKSDALKIIINIVHAPPQDLDCPQLKYKSGELVNPCLIDEHWKIMIYGKELTLKELQWALVIEGNRDREMPNNPRFPSNRIAQIRADYSVPWRLLDKVIEACGMALIWKIEYGPEAIPVYLPKDADFQATEEVRVALRYNSISPLVPAILIGDREFKDWEKFYAHMKPIAPTLKAEKIPVKLSPDSSVPFKMILDAIKTIRKCDEAILIEFSAKTPTDSKTPTEKKILDSERPGKKQADAILTGLIWLARHQNQDGSWGAKSFQNQCKTSKCSGIGDEHFDIGLTGLAVLAFTGAGYTNNSKDTFEGICFGDVIKKAALHLTNIQISDGSFGGVKEGKFIYNQAIATLAIADLYNLTMDKPAGIPFKEPLERAVKYLLEAQNPKSGWRYQPRDGQNDTSVLGWVVRALKAAEQAGIPVPPESYAGMKTFLDKVTEPTYGKVGYTERGSIALMGHEDPMNTVVQPTLTAIGVMARRLIDKNSDDPLIKLGINQIIASMPVWDTSKPGIIDFDYWFFGSYCFDSNRVLWIEYAKNALLKNQRLKKDGCGAGSWEPIDRWSGEGGRVYSTAINILTLERYYR